MHKKWVMLQFPASVYWVQSCLAFFSSYDPSPAQKSLKIALSFPSLHSYSKAQGYKFVMQTLTFGPEAKSYTHTL